MLFLPLSLVLVVVEEYTFPFCNSFLKQRHTDVVDVL